MKPEEIKKLKNLKIFIDVFLPADEAAAIWNSYMKDLEEKLGVKLDEK